MCRARSKEPTRQYRRVSVIDSPPTKRKLLLRPLPWKHIMQITPNPIEFVQLSALAFLAILGIVAPQLIPFAMAWLVIV